MRSLHLVKTSVGATWAYRLMRDLVSLGDEVHVALPLGGPMVKLYEDAGVIVHEADYSLAHGISSVKAIRKLAAEIDPDIIHSHFVLTTLLMRLALRGRDIPRVFEVPGPLHLEHSLFRRADLFTADKRLDFWIPTCRWSYDMYKSCGIDEKRLFLTYYGGDLADKSYEKGLLRKELGLKDSDIVVGMVAYMYAPKKFLGEKKGLKGHEDLIDAVALIQDRHPDLHLVIVGGAWNGAVKYEKQVIEYGRRRCRNIHFLGTRKNVPELYQDFDLVVHPSHSENLGGAMESLCLAVPTIATRVGGFPDIVKDGRTGYLVPPFNPRAIADAIERMIADPRRAQEMADNGKLLTGKMLDSKVTSKAVHGFYRIILNDRMSGNV